MSYQVVMPAIANLEIASAAIENQFVALNQWSY